MLASVQVTMVADLEWWWRDHLLWAWQQGPPVDQARCWVQLPMTAQECPHDEVLGHRTLTLATRRSHCRRCPIHYRSHLRGCYRPQQLLMHLAPHSHPESTSPPQLRWCAR